MIIAKTSSRNVAFKAAKMSESVFVGQSDALIRDHRNIYSQRGLERRRSRS